MSRSARSITLLIALCLLVPSVPARTEIKISSVEITGDAPSDLVDKIRHYIPFSSETPVTEEQVQETINGVKNLNLFKNVQYTLTPIRSGNYSLEITLNQAPKIRNITVQGNYPLLAKSITKLIPLQPGAVFDDARIEESAEIIKQYLTKQGYYNSTISVGSKPVDQYNAVDLKIAITKGKKYRIGKVVVSGNQAISTARIRNKIQHWSHFKPARLQKDIRNIEALYANHGFIKARVEVSHMIFNDDATVDLTITVEENKKLTVRIDGKPLFWKSHLKDIIALKERRSYDRYAIQQSQERLEKYYQIKGFPHPSITTEIIKPSDTQVISRYTITPGKRVALKEIKFDGNKKIGGKKLKKNLISRESGFLSPGYFYEGTLSKDRTLIEQTYLDRGFFDVQIDPPYFKSNKQGDQRTAIYPVNEGTQYRIDKITIETQDPIDKELLIKKTNLNTDKAFSAEKLNKAKIRLLEYLQALGYAYAAVTPVLTNNTTDHTVALQFKITTGPLVHVRSITLDGTMITRPNTILNNIKIKTGDPFVYQKLLDAQMNLRKMGIFTSVSMTPLGFEAQSDQIDLLVSVTERKSYEIDVRGGFDSRYWATGEISLTKHNIFGTGRQLNARAIAGPEYDRGEFTFFSPRIFGASWNLANQYFWEYEDESYYNASSYGTFISTLKKFGPHITFGFREQVSRTDLYESESDITALGDSVYDNTLNEFQLNAIYDTRNNYADPSRGFYILARDEINTNLINPSDNFNILEINASHFQGFLKRFTVINTMRFGHIVEVAGSPIIPANKLFFLGGADTLRGFDEDAVNPSGGTVSMLYNAELQLRLTNSFKLAGFFDAGTLVDDLDALDWSDFRESAGAGLRYVTPIGPLRLDWAFILDRQAGEPTNHFHFSFGYYF